MFSLHKVHEVNAYKGGRVRPIIYCRLVVMSILPNGL